MFSRSEDRLGKTTSAAVTFDLHPGSSMLPDVPRGTPYSAESRDQPAAISATVQVTVVVDDVASRQICTQIVDAQEHTVLPHPRCDDA